MLSTVVGWPHNPDLRGKGRTLARLTLAPLHRFQHPALLAADIRAGALLDGDVEAAVEAERVVAENFGLVQPADRRAHRRELLDVFAADVDEGRGGLHRHPGDHYSLQREERIARHDLAILESAGLALVGVDRQVARARVARRHERPLKPGDETGAAAAAQVGILHQRGEVLGRNRARLAHRFEPAVSAVFLERQPFLVPARQQVAVDAVGNARDNRRGASSRARRVG